MFGFIGPTEQAAEKLGIGGEVGEKHPSGAKARVILRYLRHD
jgi:hypothetical protein